MASYRYLLASLFALTSLFCHADDRSTIASADKIIQGAPVAVTDKVTSRSGNPHNYESLSIYWWPDSLHPGGPYVALDGFYNPEYKQYDFPRLQTLVKNVETVGKAYLLTQEKKYHDFLCQQIDTWFINKQTYMLPNFDYCQFIPGRNNGKGNPQGMIDAYNFNTIIDMVCQVDEVSPIGAKRMKAFKKWMKKFANWMETSDNGKVASQYKNNQAIAYETTLYRIYTLLDEPAAANTHAHTCIQHIDEQIDDEGKQPRELTRKKSRSYSLYNLEHIDYFMSLYGNFKSDQKIQDKVLKAKKYAETLPQ